MGPLARGLVAWLVCAAASLAAGPARALDKQGSAHGGGIEGPTEGSTPAAARRWACRSTTRPMRPAPTTRGLALFRYAGHADLDLIGRRLSIPIDVNMFTDRTAIGFGRKLLPSELDVIAGVTTTWRLGPGALEGGARFEVDTTLDHGGYEARARVGQAEVRRRARALPLLAGGDRARDRAGAAGRRRAWLADAGLVRDQPHLLRAPRQHRAGAVSLRRAHGDLRRRRSPRAGPGRDDVHGQAGPNKFRPSELDFTPEFIGRFARYEVHLAYERDMPVDQRRPGATVHLPAGGRCRFDVAAAPRRSSGASASSPRSAPRSTARRRGAGSW